MTIQILDDAVYQDDETFGLTLVTANNAVLGVTHRLTVTISDNDYGCFLPLVLHR